MKDAKNREESIFSTLDIREKQEVFQNAINKGMKNPNDWMYMYTSGTRDYFKNHITRKYISYRRSDASTWEDIRCRLLMLLYNNRLARNFRFEK